MVGIIDYGAGNLQSVKKALDFLGYESEITMDREKILSASHVILPGVGSFGDAMASIRERGLEDIIKQAASGEKHFLGICLGLQLMFEKSDETPGVEGLGIFKGDIVKIPSDSTPKKAVKRDFDCSKTLWKRRIEPCMQKELSLALMLKTAEL